MTEETDFLEGLASFIGRDTLNTSIGKAIDLTKEMESNERRRTLQKTAEYSFKNIDLSAMPSNTFMRRNQVSLQGFKK